MTLAVVSTHPIQYQAPVYRALQSQFGIRTVVIYGSDFSIVGYRDREFGTTIAWDTNLLEGYESVFLSRAITHNPASERTVTANGLSKALRAAKPDAILLLGYRPRFDLRAFLISRQYGVPLLFRAEAADHGQQRGKAKQIVRDFSLLHFYKQFSRILYIGQNAMTHYKRLGYPQNRLIFSPYCVNTASFHLSALDRNSLRTEGRVRLQIESEAIVFLVSGKLSPRKNPDIVINAVKKMTAQLQRRIVIVYLGDGELRPNLETLALEQPTVRVSFPGFQNQSQLSVFYHAADLLIMPSVSGETWGLVVNEALHHGIPCVVSDQVGCAPDLIKTGITGEVFEAGNVEALINAIERALLLIGRVDIAEKCRTQVDRYTVEAAASGIAAAYHEAVKL